MTRLDIRAGHEASKGSFPNFNTSLTLSQMSPSTDVSQWGVSSREYSHPLKLNPPVDIISVEIFLNKHPSSAVLTLVTQFLTVFYLFNDDSLLLRRGV